MVLQRLGGGRDLVSPWRGGEIEDGEAAAEKLSPVLSAESVSASNPRRWLWLSGASHLLGSSKQIMGLQKMQIAVFTKLTNEYEHGGWNIYIRGKCCLKNEDVALKAR